MKPAQRIAVLLAGTVLAACGDSTPPAALAARADPFAQLPPPDTAGLTNVSHDLEAVLEYGTLPGACERWEADKTDDRKRLACGKFLFFYGHYDTLGAPAPFVDYLLKWFPQHSGPGFSALGMIPDPYSDRGYPIGMTPTAPIMGLVPALAYSCASCHFGRLKDGRYAVGYGSHEFDYGRQIIQLTVFPVLALNRFGRSDGSHDARAVAMVQPMLDEYDATPQMQLELAAVMAQVAPIIPFFELPGKEHEAAYARFPVGVQDFFMPPTAYDDEVFTLHKAQSLWGMPTIEQAAQAGMHGAMLGWAGTVFSLEHFAELFVYLGGGDRAAWPRERLQPLADYIYSLRAPANPDPPPAAAVARGAALFEARGCLGCHDAPSGAGKRVYRFDEIGTDDALRLWLDGPDGDGRPCCGVEETDEDRLTGGVKSPRLVGLWTMSRFLHNGSVPSLEALFCLGVERPTVLESPFSDRGHRFTCDGLDEAEKRDLIAYLLSH
jgi:mono/diheme cytochrome c family protein